MKRMLAIAMAALFLLAALSACAVQKEPTRAQAEASPPQSTAPAQAQPKEASPQDTDPTRTQEEDTEDAEMDMPYTADITT